MDKPATHFEDLRICHVNCQSLYAHFDEFQHFFLNSGYHIICLSETWLRPEVTDAMVGLAGYTLFRCDREGRTGGGVAFYLSDMLRAAFLKSSSEFPVYRPEFIIAEILFKGTSKLLLAVVYRPHNSGYLNKFFQLFLEQQVHFRHSIIFGDFNADMLQHTFDSRQLNTFITASGLHLVPFGSTHHLRNSSTLLHLCIIDDSDKLIEYGQHEVAFLSAHDLIHIKYGMGVERRSGRFTTSRDWCNLNEEAFLSDIREINWTSLFTSSCIDKKIEIFNSKLLDLLNQHASLKRRHFRNLYAPWLTDVIRHAMRDRNLARRTWRRRSNSQDYDKYKILRNKAQNLIRNAKLL